ncbi:MAG TPA: lysophospholipid acyltransferase family protein [Solirubrobacteraceae bacterium]|nr:lysophospholipid acyltransferase family protein [Solirubrobacteraceae bacterium]
MDLDRLPSPASTVAQWRHSHSPASAGEPDLGEIRACTLDRGVNLPLYLIVRAILVPFFRIYLRLQGVGGEEVPRSGPLLLASNHRSFLDPFVIGALVRRPFYYVAKRELFARGWQAWLLQSLGAFPIDRGHSDQDAMATAKQILSRGDCVVIFPEGTRVRKGPLGAPRRGVGRLALETGAPVVPVAVIGTDQVRRGWRVRPRKVRVRFGRITRLPQMDEVSPSLAAAATGRVWACVALQWEWLGGQAPPRLESRGRQRQASAVAPSSESQHAGVRCVE